MTTTAVLDVTVEEIPIPATLDGPEGDDFRAAIDVRNAAASAVVGGSDVLSYTAEELLPTWQRQEFDPHRLFVARAGGRIAGRGVLAWTATDEAEGSDLVVEVRPELDRAGVREPLLAAMEAEALATGRPVLSVWAEHPWRAPDGSARVASPTGFGEVAADDPFVALLLDRGYSLGQVARISRLDLPLDPAYLQGRLAAARERSGEGYRVVAWTGRTPPERVDDVVAMKKAMDLDEPKGDLVADEEPWDAARLADSEETHQRMGRLLLVGVAEHVESGSLVGITELSLPADRSRAVGQEDTLVIGPHRGHGLGMLLKLENLATLAVASPGSPCVITYNAEENRYMLDTNEAVGFVPVGSESGWQKRP